VGLRLLRLRVVVGLVEELVSMLKPRESRAWPLPLELPLQVELLAE
jgi:hypothetical protein